MNDNNNEQKNYDELSLELHKKLQGKLDVVSKKSFDHQDDWATMYTPGIAAVSKQLADHPETARDYSIKGTTIAVVSDGSRVLGLGNIGPLGALPVMEGKAAIFKEMAGVNAFPLVLNTQDTEEIITAVKNIAPGFGGINLEDIEVPKCFEIEDRLKEELDIPVFHDDQHGTAICSVAGMLNAAKVVNKQPEDMKVVVMGAGAAGRAIALLMVDAGFGNVVSLDSKGAISKERDDLVPYKEVIAEKTNPHGLSGSASEIIEGADAIVAVSIPGSVTQEHIKSMNEDPIVFALANPTPEIMPEDAKEAGVRVMATGRSDFPNQVNNSLVFPGIFRGALDNRVSQITETMKINAARAIANLIENPDAQNIIPHTSTEGLVEAVAAVITEK